MKKNTFYFPHDYNARNDLKLVKLKIGMGNEGIGIYWQVIEMLYENNGVMPTQYDCIAEVLRTQCDLVISVITKYDLFVVNETEFYSTSVLHRLKVRQDICEKAKESANKRWEKEKKNANALPSQCQPNARKGKERKEKESMQQYNRGMNG